MGTELERRLQALPGLRDLYTLWHGKCVDGTLPSWRDFDVLELQQWLGYLNVVDVAGDPFDFHYRIFGSDLTAAIGDELTGRRYRESLRNALADEIAESYRTVHGDPQPVLIRHRQPAWHGKPISFDRLLLPMRSDDNGATRIVLVGAYVSSTSEPQL